ncbi:MAG TPA: transglutaminase family protein [Verrucomicrobiae bacterium]|jgi:transglutaminase-like putative cysteine protease|nr:transglutaminase family protein [Verrucomicrobiae bacterium]
MKYRVTHSTRYGYGEAIPLSHNVVRMKPREHETQTCLQYQLLVLPAPTVRNEGFDYFGNHVTWFSLQEPHTVLRIAAHSEVQVLPAGPYDLERGITWEDALQVLGLSPDREALAAREYVFESPHVPWSAELANFARPSFPARRPYLACLMDLTQRIHTGFNFLAGSTAIDTSVEEVFHSHQGVCQDFAHLQICCLRSLGFSARYVSGYLVTAPPPGKEKLAGADVSHAWISAYVPGVGWVDFDPTNGMMPSDAHITLAWGRDYDDVGPSRGILLGGRRHWMDVSVDVAPVEAA